VGGYDWFGSIASTIKLRKRLKVHSIFVDKNNTNLYTMRILHRLLKARYSEQHVLHWVIMRTSISDVPIFEIAYTWIQRSVSYFISTCGSTEMYETKYSHFEDYWGNVTIKEINRPKILHYVYAFLPLIDDYNKQRQIILSI